MTETPQPRKIYVLSVSFTPGGSAAWVLGGEFHAAFGVYTAMKEAKRKDNPGFEFITVDASIVLDMRTTCLVRFSEVNE